MCARKKLRSIKEKEALVRLFGLLGVKSPFEGIPPLGNINQWCKMNKIINNFLLSGDKFIPEIHLTKLFTKNKETIQKLEVTGDTTYLLKGIGQRLLSAWYG